MVVSPDFLLFCCKHEGNVLEPLSQNLATEKEINPLYLPVLFVDCYLDCIFIPQNSATEPVLPLLEHFAPKQAFLGLESEYFGLALEGERVRQFAEVAEGLLLGVKDEESLVFEETTIGSLFDQRVHHKLRDLTDLNRQALPSQLL